MAKLISTGFASNAKDQQKMAMEQPCQMTTYISAKRGRRPPFCHFLHLPIRPQYPHKKCGFHHFNPPTRQRICGFGIHRLDHIRCPHPHADSVD
uniref:Uncharacterized protein n=1 Tax=Romanomermis culicivorax TaxID=13658 RepID=A0A915HV43_ROMCU